MPQNPRTRSSEPQPQRNTSWQPVSSWYHGSVGESGHYYHQHVVLPGVLKLLNLKEDDSLLDLGCGQGVLARAIPTDLEYNGVDAAASLIQEAKKLSEQNPKHHFVVANATKPLPIQKKDFSCAAVVLALQNMKEPEGALENVAKHVNTNGRLVLVLNHPAFRIPRQSSWGIDENTKTQYRRVDRYMTPLEIPITAHPGKQHSAVTWSYHKPLSAYSAMLLKHGFVIELIEEWISDKASEGKAAKMENRSRTEFPMFMAIKARKIS